MARGHGYNATLEDPLLEKDQSSMPTTDRVPVSAVAEFDLEAWLASGTVPHVEVEVSPMRAESARLDEIMSEIDHLKTVEAAVEADGKTVRRAGARHSPQMQTLLDEAAALLDSMTASSAVVSISSPGAVAANRLGDDAQKLPNRAERLALGLRRFATIRHGDSEPVSLTTKQWLDVFDAIGSVQFLRVETAMNDAIAAGGRVVTPDFSELVSSSRGGRASARR